MTDGVISVKPNTIFRCPGSGGGGLIQGPGEHPDRRTRRLLLDHGRGPRRDIGRPHGGAGSRPGLGVESVTGSARDLTAARFGRRAMSNVADEILVHEIAGRDVGLYYFDPAAWSAGSTASAVESGCRGIQRFGRVASAGGSRAGRRGEVTAGSSTRAAAGPRRL